MRGGEGRNGRGSVIEEENLEGSRGVWQRVMGAEDPVHVRLCGQWLQTLLLQMTGHTHTTQSLNTHTNTV